ncbi:MAG: hypothetical protein IPH26_04560 [Sterolibacteriaceae bacterium]|uniref:Nucleotidyltransferase-like domain-containing protein n=1 Tax=Candidatus Methylophosphatis roskildensis TaxID=2899263 RepID=A0A9D7E1Q6_9PROT|nr:hypothetical protein [Candidatus Methylophosphatis roskildensis]MBK7238384.1 hypothetical protein [Sterolibacteriaceae bacterium]
MISEPRGTRPVVMKQLNLVLEPLKFMGFSLEQTTQGCVFANLGACVAKLPAAERFAVHKLIVFGERPDSEWVNAAKDLPPTASLASWFLDNGQADVFNAVWRDALGRGRGWRARAQQGKGRCCVWRPTRRRGTLVGLSP